MSTTNYLNLNKHDNVTTNQDAFDIENYLNGNWDKIDQETSSQNTLIQRLKKNQIYGTATGTEVEITDSAEMGANIDVSGNSTQDEEPSPSNPSEIKNLTGNTVCTVTNESNQEKSVTFPFGSQKLAKGDYLASDGIHNTKRQSVVNITYIVTLDNGNIGGACYLANKKYVRKNYLLCSKAIFDKGVTGLTKAEGTVYENESNVVIVGTSSDTLETLKEKYDGAIIEYELAEPTVTPYTQAQQTAYDNLQNLILYEGYNYIEMISPNGVKANLTVDYTKSTKMVINDIEERLSALEYAGLEV